MTVLSELIMVGSAGLCFGCSLIGKSRFGTGAAAIMLAAMVDSAYTGVISPLFWAGLLVLCGTALGLGLRLTGAAHASSALSASRGPCGSSTLALEASRAALSRTIMILTALAYPAMAWLLLTHDHGVDGSSTGHHHGSGALMLSLGPELTVALLIGAFVLTCVIAGARRYRLLGLEAGAMAVMLVSMQLPGSFAP